MATLDDFIAKARAKNLDDETIRQALEKQGWDRSSISLALAGMAAPSPHEAYTNNPTVHEPTTHSSPSLNPLLAALHHVLLWFFVLASTISIVAVVASLLGKSVESDALAALMAVVLVAFTPYAVLYVLYLRKLRAQPSLIPNKTWSIITVCIHSLGALIAAITLVVNLIVDGNQTTIISSALVLALMVIVLITYIFAAFAPSASKARKPVLLGYLPIVALLLGTLFTLSALRLGPALADETTRDNLVTTVENIRDNVEDNNRLPNNEQADSFIEGSDITYEKISDTTYKLCATFKVDRTVDQSSYRSSSASQPISDSYIQAYDFYSKKGNQCFTVQSEALSSVTKDILFSPTSPFND